MCMQGNKALYVHRMTIDSTCVSILILLRELIKVHGKWLRLKEYKRNVMLELGELA